MKAKQKKLKLFGKNSHLIHVILSLCNQSNEFLIFFFPFVCFFTPYGTKRISSEKQPQVCDNKCHFFIFCCLDKKKWITVAYRLLQSAYCYCLTIITIIMAEKRSTSNGNEKAIKTEHFVLKSGHTILRNEFTWKHWIEVIVQMLLVFSKDYPSTAKPRHYQKILKKLKKKKCLVSAWRNLFEIFVIKY